MSLYSVVRLACDRCGATAERPPSDTADGGLDGWRWLEAWPDGGRAPDEARHLCPACADRFAWFLAGGPVLDETGAEHGGDDVVVAWLTYLAWPWEGGDEPDQTRCAACEAVHRRGGAECPCPCHPARTYLAAIGRLRDVQDHWKRPPVGAAGARDGGGDTA